MASTPICDFEVIGAYTFELMYNKTQFAVLSNLYSLDIGDSQAEPQLMLEQTEFSYVSHASASPNGEMVAFVVREESGSATLSNIYIANRDGSNAQRLTFNNLRNTEPAWSPDGNRIAFSGHVSSEEVNVWVIDIDGNNAVNLTEDLHGGMHKSPSWSPCFEGAACRIAYSSLTDSGVRIWSMLDDGSDKQQLTFGDQVHDSEPDWSPDGSTIVFIRNAANIVSDLYLVSADGGEGEPLIQQNLEYGEFSPSWSPDGSMIAFSSDHENAEYLQIWTVWADGTNLVKRTTDSKDHFNPGWFATNL